jgi:hypothetical protein
MLALTLTGALELTVYTTLALVMGCLGTGGKTAS